MGRCQPSGASALGEPAAPCRLGSPSLPTGETAAKSRQLTCLDLFCGCGGFTLGMERAGHLTAHFARPHSHRDLRDFARLNEGNEHALFLAA